MTNKLFRYHDDDLHIHHTCDEIPLQSGFVLHAHRNYELYYFISGTGHYSVEGTEYPLTPGCLLVLRDGEVHTPHMYGKEPYERMSINFNPERMPALSEELRSLFCNRPLGKDNYYLPGEDCHAFIDACMRRLCQGGEDSNYKAHAETLLMNVLLELYRIKCRGESEQVVKAPVPDSNAEIVSRIIGYINENLTTIENLDVLEQEFFFSKSYINRMFKRSTGSSVWDYIVLKRLLLSRTMLREGKQAGLVAAECGFSDYSSFYRQFKNRFGVSPLAAKQLKG